MSSKALKLICKYLKSRLYKNSFFLHISPLSLCNLNCSYCYQVNESSSVMSYELFEDIIDKLTVQNRLGIVAFTGGEPFLWKHILTALKKCKKKGIFSQITTNGSRLNYSYIDKLAESGLDYLSVSIDGYDQLLFSEKTIFNNTKLFDYLLYARDRHNIIVSCNFVITEHNIDQVDKILELTKYLHIPTSLGFYVPPPEKKQDSYFSNKELSDNFQNLILKIIDKKKNGYPILESSEYFKKFKSFLENTFNWDCNIAKKYTIQINSDGDIYWCSKLRKISPYNYKNISSNFNNFKMELSKKIKSCNSSCYSNCAFNSFYYQTHKYEFIKEIFLKKYLYLSIFRKKIKNESTIHFPKPRSIPIEVRKRDLFHEKDDNLVI